MSGMGSVNPGYSAAVNTSGSQRKTANNNHGKRVGTEVRQVHNELKKMKCVKTHLYEVCKTGVPSGSGIGIRGGGLRRVSNLGNNTTEGATHADDTQAMQTDKVSVANQFYQSLNALGGSEHFHRSCIKEAVDDFAADNTSKAAEKFLSLHRSAGNDETAKECVESFLVMRKMVKEQMAPDDTQSQKWLADITAKFVSAINKDGLGPDSPAAGSSLKGNGKLLKFRAICNQMSSRLPTDDMSYNQKIGNIIQSVIAAVPDGTFIDQLMQNVGATVFREAEQQHNAMMNTLGNQGGRFAAVRENLIHQTLILDLLRNGLQELVENTVPPQGIPADQPNATPERDPAKDPEASRPNSPIIYNDFSTHYNDNSIRWSLDEGDVTSVTTRQDDHAKTQGTPPGGDEIDGAYMPGPSVEEKTPGISARSTQTEPAQNPVGASHSTQTATQHIDEGYESEPEVTLRRFTNEGAATQTPQEENVKPQPLSQNAFSRVAGQRETAQISSSRIQTGARRVAGADDVTGKEAPVAPVPGNQPLAGEPSSVNPEGLDRWGKRSYVQMQQDTTRAFVGSPGSAQALDPFSRVAGQRETAQVSATRIQTGARRVAGAGDVPDNQPFAGEQPPVNPAGLDRWGKRSHVQMQQETSRAFIGSQGTAQALDTFGYSTSGKRSALPHQPAASRVSPSASSGREDGVRDSEDSVMASTRGHTTLTGNGVDAGHGRFIGSVGSAQALDPLGNNGTRRR